jgi:homoserine acetyltransferase
MTDCEVFELGDVVLQSGATLRRAKLAYKTYGRLSPAKDNVVVYPTWYSGQHSENEGAVRPGCGGRANLTRADYIISYVQPRISSPQPS